MGDDFKHCGIGECALIREFRDRVIRRVEVAHLLRSQIVESGSEYLELDFRDRCRGHQLHPALSFESEPRMNRDSVHLHHTRFPKWGDVHRVRVRC